MSLWGPHEQAEEENSVTWKILQEHLHHDVSVRSLAKGQICVHCESCGKVLIYARDPETY